MAQRMIKRGLKGTKFSIIEPTFPGNMDNIGWYIHMPFCRSLCPFCSFRSIQYSAEKVQPYIEAVKREINMYRNKLGNSKTGDIYFGGGTPSLTWKGVIDIIEHIRSVFDIEGEIGSEANPEDINTQTVDALKKAGVTKISLGVQSFGEATLKEMRRGYYADAVLKAIEILLHEGFYVSTDLLYAFPRHQKITLMKDLNQVVTSGAHQVSVYPLMLFPYTKWFHDVKKGLLSMPSSGLEKEMFYVVCDFLTASGYNQISCWDFIKASKTKNPYVTCTRDENIGIGLSAYNKIGDLFYVNTFSLKQYIERVETGLPIATGTVMPPQRVMRRWFMMGLYRLCVNKAEFEKRFGFKIEQVLGRFILMLKLLNIVKVHPEYIQTTRSGMYWVSLMTKTSMLTFPYSYYEECLRNPWPADFEIQ